MSALSQAMKAAMRFHQAGNLAEAERIYRQVLAAQPDHADALQLLGLLEHHAGRYEAAVELIGRAIAAVPRAPALHNNLGEAYRCLGRLDEARRCYRRAVELNPKFAQAHHNLGVLAAARGAIEEAVGHYRRALAADPRHAEALNNLGHALCGKGELEAAAECLRKAIAFRPGFAEAHNNLGTVLLAQSRPEEAKLQFEQALACRPGYAAGVANLGALAQESSDPEQALGHYRKALELDPGMSGVLVNMGIVLSELGRPAEARAAYARALEIEPRDAVRVLHGCVLAPIPASKAEMLEARRGYAEHLAALFDRQLSIRDPVKEVNSVPFYLAYQGFDDRDPQRLLARIYERATPSLAFRAPHCDSPDPPQARRKLRLGFVSRVIGRQSVARVLMSGLLGRLSRERFSVSVFSFPHGRNDDLEQIKACADRVVMLPPVLETARERLAEERLDFLCHIDIGMDPLTYFLAFARLAPVQCATWQHPVTTGIPNVDYFVSSALFEPEGAEAHYSERLVRLPSLPAWYERPEPPAPLKPRAALGLKEGLAQYVCPQSPYKIHPDFDRLLGAILRADPQGEVVLIEGRLEAWARLLRERMRRTIPEVMERVRWVPRLSSAAFQHLLASADVLLDPLHWSGGITTLDALGFGTPIVTLPGALMRGRVTYGCYRHMGMLDCVAGSEQEYAALAVRLGMDRTYREAMRAKILASNSVLYRNEAAVREFEQFVCSATA
jgi:predicted O-linked N-acetylglucosamine transferase (SPINDLY family)